MKKIFIYIVVLALPFVGFSQTEKSNEAKKWEFNVTPYLWMTALDGDLTVLDQQKDVNVSFDDVLADLKLAAMLHAEAKNGNWSIMLDAFYAKLKETGTVKGGAGEIIAGDEIDATILQNIYELGLGYTFVKVNNFNMDVLFGGRYFSVDTKLENTTKDRTIGDVKIDFIDPYVGLRMANHWDKWAVGGRFDVGGFGVGSEISYKYNVMVGYKFSELFQLDLGYQSYRPDYIEKKLLL
jgi:hypothetical protein